jgi:YidC/Oxa1 family membrane protein insertase
LATDNRRLLVATVASIAVVVFWQMLFAPKKGAVPPRDAAAVTAPAAKPAETGAAAGGSVAPVAPAAALANAPEELVTLEGKDFVVVVSSHGGTLASVTLKGDKFVEEKNGKTQPIDLARSAEQVRPLALVATKENGGTGDLWTDPAAVAPMRIVSKSSSSVVLEGVTGGLTVRKTYRLTGKPQEVALDLEVDGASGKGGASLLMAGQLSADVKTGGLTSAPSLEMFRLVCRGGEKTERYDVNDD